MSKSPVLGLTMMSASQAQKETVFNEFLIAFDALFKGSVISASLTAPPGSPASGDAYVVGPAATGAWSGQADAIAFYFNGWQFVTPPLKIKLYNQATSKFITYQGPSTHWTEDPTSAVSALGDLTNVAGSPTDGQVLTWDVATGKWKPKTPAFLGQLIALSDVTVSTGPSIDGQALYWDNTSGKWKTKAFLSSVTPPTFLGLSDVTKTGAADGWVVVYQGGVTPTAKFVDPTTLTTVRSLQNIGDVSYGGGLHTGDVLTWNGATWGPASYVNTYSFVGMTDGPGAFDGHAGHLLRVNPVESALEYVAPGTALGLTLAGLTDVSIATGAGIDGWVVYWDNGSTKWKAKALSWANISGKPSFAAVATSGAYADLTGAPSLATVATTGAYADLTGKPTLFSGAYADLTGKPALFSGAYADLTGKPPIPTTFVSLTDVSMAPGSGTDGYVVYWDNASTKFKLKLSSGSGALTSLTDVNVATGAGIDGYVLYWNNTDGKWKSKALATVATSGSYNDLSSRPTIPTNSSFSFQGLSDVNVTEGGAIDGYSLRWDNATSKWLSYSVQIANLGDTTIASPSTGQMLVFSGSKWVNKSVADLPSYLVGSVSGAITLDRSKGETQIITLAGNVTGITVSNWGGPNTLSKLNLVIVNGGAFTVSWPSAKWSGGTPPTVTPGAGKTDIYTFITYDGGTTLFGNVVGQNFS